MAINRQLRELSQGLKHRRADGEVGDKMPIHYIKMHHRSSAFGSGTDLIRQVGEIGRQNRSCKLYQIRCLAQEADDSKFITIPPQWGRIYWPSWLSPRWKMTAELVHASNSNFAGCRASLRSANSRR